MNKTLKIFILSLVILPLAGLGCGQKVTEKLAEDQINRELDGQGEFAYTGDGWQYEDEETGTQVQVGENVSIPDNFPDDVPLYPGAKARSVSYNPEQDLHGFVVLVTNDDVDTVMAWYADQASKNGWTQSGSFNMEGTQMLMFTQGDRAMNVSSAPTEEDDNYATMITVAVTQM